MWNFCLPVYFILCLFPVIPFCCARPERYYCGCCKNHTHVNGEQTWYSTCCRKVLKCACVCFAFVFSYMFCFRPIISTFTFLFRVLTYFFLRSTTNKSAFSAIHFDNWKYTCISFKLYLRNHKYEWRDFMFHNWHKKKEERWDAKKCIKCF